MKVAVVVPAYNGARYLADTLTSVATQTLTDWELIVVDDGSRDDTVAVARQYAAGNPRVRVVEQSNAGVGAARNRGIDEASRVAEAFLFLDQDDLLLPHALSAMCDALRSNPEMFAAHGDARYVDAQAKPIRCGELEGNSRNRRRISKGRVVNLALNEPTTFAVLTYWNCIHTPGQAIIRRSAFERIGCFDTETTLPDVDIWLRLAQHSDIAYLNSVVLNYRWHETNASRQSAQMGEGIRYVRRKLLSNTSLTSDQRRLALVGTRRCQRDIAQLRWEWAVQEFRHQRFGGAARQLRHALVAYRRALCGPPV